MLPSTDNSPNLASEIVAANLRYGATAEPLRARAYAHVVCKFLLSVRPEQPQLPHEIREGCRALILRGRPTNAQIQAAIRLLEKQKVVQAIGKPGRERYHLTDASRLDLEHQLTSRRERVDKAITRHFPLYLQNGATREWLDKVAARYFAAYGDQWVRDITKRPINAPPFRREQIDQLVQEIPLQADLDSQEKNSARGLRSFLVSEDREDQALVWHYGRAMFSARLMAADLAADPYTAEQFRKAVVLLDTNVLIDFTLAWGESLVALQALAKALDHHEVTVGYLPSTLNEYGRVHEQRRNKAMNLIREHMAIEVLENANDDWIRAGVRRGIHQSNEWEQFFTDLADPLGELTAGIAPRKISDGELIAAAEAGATDTALVDKIQEVWARVNLNKSPKGKTRAEHDAALEAAARYLRTQNQPCVLITTDRSMLVFASEQGGHNGLPTWLSLEALLQVFATEQASGTESAVDFAPLLSHIVAEDLYQMGHSSYTLDDLDYLAGMEVQVTDLPSEDLQHFARELHQLRLSGASRDDDELRLKLRNQIASRRRELGHEIESAQSNAAKANSKAADLQAEVARLKLEKEAEVREKQEQEETRVREKREQEARVIEKRTNKIKSQALVWIRVTGIIGALGGVGFLYGAFRLIMWGSSSPGGLNPENLIGNTTGIIGLLSGCFAIAFWPMNHFINRRMNAQQIAVRQLRVEGVITD